MGLKKITLSPPKNICGSQSLISVKKLIFSPEASGKRPRIVVIAVNKTGLSLVFPPSITCFEFIEIRTIKKLKFPLEMEFNDDSNLVEYVICPYETKFFLNNFVWT